MRPRLKFCAKVAQRAHTSSLSVLSSTRSKNSNFVYAWQATRVPIVVNRESFVGITSVDDGPFGPSIFRSRVTQVLEKLQKEEG